MTTPPEDILVDCPQCGKRYKDWYRPSINLSLGEHFSEEYLRRATTGTCPHCGHVVELGTLVVSPDRVFQFRQPEAKVKRRRRSPF